MTLQRSEYALGVPIRVESAEHSALLLQDFDVHDVFELACCSPSSSENLIIHELAERLLPAIEDLSFEVRNAVLKDRPLLLQVLHQTQLIANGLPEPLVFSHQRLLDSCHDLLVLSFQAQLGRCWLLDLVRLASKDAGPANERPPWTDTCPLLQGCCSSQVGETEVRFLLGNGIELWLA